MAHINVTGTTVTIKLSTGEKVAATRGDLSFDRGNITEVTTHDDGFDATKGIRAPGFAWPNSRRIGTWRRIGGKELVSVRKGEPAVRIELRDEPYTAVVVGVPDADDAARLLRRG